MSRPKPTSSFVVNVSLSVVYIVAIVVVILVL
jgi:hypothetical protein